MRESHDVARPHKCKHLKGYHSICITLIEVVLAGGWSTFLRALKGLCHRHRYMNGWYDNAYDQAPTRSISIQIARTKNMRLYCGQQRNTSNPVSCDIAPLSTEMRSYRSLRVKLAKHAYAPVRN